MLLNVVPSADYVLTAEINGHCCPLPELVHSLRVLLKLIFINIKVLLEEGHLLIVTEFSGFRPGKLVLSHLLVVGLVTDDLAYLLESEFVGR